jgi:hypothetical protein
MTKQKRGNDRKHKNCCTNKRNPAGHGDGKEVALSFLDDAKKKVGGSAEAAKDFVADHADSVKDGITKAGAGPRLPIL